MRKQFFYTGKTYQNATYTETYTRVSRWIKISYTLTEESRPYIRHDNRRFYLDNLRRNSFCGLPTVIKAADGEEIQLAGHDATTYYKPYFIELDDGGEAARLYRYEGSETDYTA